MWKRLERLLWLNKDIIFIVPSLSAEELLEKGKIVSYNTFLWSPLDIKVRSYVDGHVYDCIKEDIISFKNKGINSLWKMEILMQKKLFKKPKKKLKK